MAILNPSPFLINARTTTLNESSYLTIPSYPNLNPTGDVQHPPTVTSDEHCVGLGVVLDRLSEPVGQLTLTSRVLNDGHHTAAVETVALDALRPAHNRGHSMQPIIDFPISPRLDYKFDPLS